MLHRFSFWLILILTWPIRLLPYRTIHSLGKGLGICVYYLVPKYRKRCLSNLALASTLNLSEAEIIANAKASLQNLMITCLEYAKFASEKEIHSVVSCENPEEADALMSSGKPVIFFCGHQANWEVLFLEGTKRMPGVAIGRPIKNSFLYRWILAIRQKHGGLMLSPKNAIKEGLRGLKRGSFLGIVSDQGMPDSGYSSLFLGRLAWTSPMAAMLAHRTGSPIMVATTRREKGKYVIHYSPAIWPDPSRPLNEESDRLMKACLKTLEETIQERPHEWLWSHNRWKQQTPDKLHKRFRHESILVVIPEEERLLSQLTVLRTLYPTEFLTLYLPEAYRGRNPIPDAELHFYSDSKELFQRDFRFKLVIDLTNTPGLFKHFSKLAAFDTLSLQEILQDAPLETFAETLKKMALKDAP